MKVHAGTMVANTRGTLKAFDASGNVMDQDGKKPVTTGAFAVVFQVRTQAATIRRVELLYEAGVIVDIAEPGPVPAGSSEPFEGIDDLEFDNGPAPPAPVAVLTAPTKNQQLTGSSVRVRGAITGQELDSPAKLRHRWLVRPGSQRPTIGETSIPVATSGTTNFDVTESLQIGTQWFTVRATNAGNLEGSSATVQVNYLPRAIRDRFAAEGGAATFGAFSFGEGAISSTCTYAAYQRGLIALSSGRTHVVRGSLFNKWLFLENGGVREDGGNYPRMGCPTSERRTVAGNVRAQDFQNGRLYGGSGGTFYVNPVFVQAIDELGGEAATGTPTADPSSDSRAPFLVWQFQPFRKLDAVGQPTLRSALQIQGPYATPRLYVSRQGGDNSLYGSSVPMSAETPTQMVSFPCSGVDGPCSPAAPPPDVPFPNPGSYCNNEVFGPSEQLTALSGETPSPLQWAPIFGNYVQTPFYGIVRTFRIASGDNPFSHDWWFGSCPWPPGTPIPSPTLTLVKLALSETVCSSDWNINARGLPGYAGLQSAGRSSQHIEWERYFSQAFLLPFQPHPGDLVFVSGRYIVDCGHNNVNWKTEIHPPSVVAFMRTETYNRRPSTRAQIWVNGFYSGDPVQFDIIPPPRPSPTATLGFVKADYGGTPVDVTVTSTTPESNRVRVHVTASPRQVPITSQGQMKWQAGRAYYSRWNVYWEESSPPGPPPPPPRRHHLPRHRRRAPRAVRIPVGKLRSAMAAAASAHATAAGVATRRPSASCRRGNVREDPSATRMACRHAFGGGTERHGLRGTARLEGRRRGGSGRRGVHPGPARQRPHGRGRTVRVDPRSQAAVRGAGGVGGRTLCVTPSAWRRSEKPP